MNQSISYVEINCNYNKSDLKQFSGALQDRDARRIVVYRGRLYFLAYHSDSDMFSITDKYGVLVAEVSNKVFAFYASNVPEIGLEFIWGLLARLNIYPATSL